VRGSSSSPFTNITQRRAIRPRKRELSKSLPFISDRKGTFTPDVKSLLNENLGDILGS
jgi:hypothetical protein